MVKKFFEVFPTLKIDQDMKTILSDAEVTKVSANKNKTVMRIYLNSCRLIPKVNIWSIEKMIHDQLFKNQNIDIRIIESFQLSALYTPEKLHGAYKNSISEEIKRYSSLLFQIYRCAQFDFTTENLLTVRLEDTLIAREKSEDLALILEKIFCERCGMNLNLQFDFTEKKENQKIKNSDLQIQQEIKQIIDRTGSVSIDQESISSNKASLPDLQSDTRLLVEVAVKDSAQKPNEKKAIESRNYGRRGMTKSYLKSDNPDVIYGKDFEDEVITLDMIQGEMGEVVIRGEILAISLVDLKNGKTIVLLTVTDYTDSIMAKIFTRNEDLETVTASMQKGTYIKLKGMTTYDNFGKEFIISSVVGVKTIPSFKTIRQDTSPLKRVELHCHTKMSDMDGVADVTDLIETAHAWGHSSIAITDHGDVQSFATANHVIENIEKNDPDFKVIYGLEAYLVDDLKSAVQNANESQTFRDTFVIFDLETTGFSPARNNIIEIGAVKVQDGKITDRYSKFVNPCEPIPFEIEKLTGIRDDMVIGEAKIDEVLPEFLKFCEGAIMVAHNAEFDMGFIKYQLKKRKIKKSFTVIDTVSLARILLPALHRYKLDTVAKSLGISLEHHHRAVDDAKATAEIFEKFIEMLENRGVTKLLELLTLTNTSQEAVKKLPAHHAIILAANDIGRINLYRLVSMSHIDYFYKTPRIPKSELIRHKEGLIIGSACEAGELYQALLFARPDEEIARIIDFYDYLEIQPTGNNQFMIYKEKIPVHSISDIQDINKKIVQLGEEYNKPVVATCDVHFLNSEDEVYRRIIMAGKGFQDADDQAPLYLRTTEEMLEEFSYLGSSKAEEVVITNTNKIADRIEKIYPVRPDKCPPVIENSDQMLRDICYIRAHELYGKVLPVIVKERLDRELNSIISNGYAVMYIISQKLVWKSVEDGYLVGSRGSVGSSFAATMAGITEVNPLSAHYRCTHCFYSDFESEDVKKFSGRSGCDMPDKICPECGAQLQKDGFDIPFETFLGFKGNKEPDIDLNFSGEYQSKAHAYTEIIFGYGQTFRAGTIGSLAEKTAYGFIKKYYEERGLYKRKCEVDRIVQGCIGVRRTTGQHPGGIIVLPVGEEINSFTPVQRPANDMNTTTITTHFDYHSIDHNLLKLDILGHDDPTMIRMLQDLTGIDPVEIPLDDDSVMSLFMNTKALFITPEDILGCKLGALGIPEFGTDFAIEMLLDAKPKEFSDLIRISGLSHGTDVWLGNAKTLIEEEKATISTAICTRDDIMIYLISMGLDSEMAFSIMESVRKGKGLRPEWKTAMQEHNVPEWYIWSCEKIKYMFPKAHAAAYVMMAWRIAYCKVFYPLAYYAAYFSIRATGFTYELMCQGKEKLEYFMKDFEKRKDILSNKEKDILKDMKIVQEMYARGFEFWPLDIYRADAARFQIIDGKLMPSLSTIDGLGDKAAEAVVEASKFGKYLSRDDFKQRTKVSASVIDLMGDLGILGDLPASNQLSLFDLK
ncbi:MAG: PolC-type DNA polymerase III [Lachnospiraceae bacterium]